MPRKLSSRSPSFYNDFAALLAEKRESASEVGDTVAAILADVKARGDAAVLDYTQRFDRMALKAEQLAVGADEIERAVAACEPATLAALKVAADRIEAFHLRQRPSDDRFTDAAGVELGHRWTPLTAVGLYVPGGKAAYPSSLLMNAIPARVAGVPRRVMVVPTPNGVFNPLILAAAKLAGIGEIYRIGGAQAIGALAYGTRTIAAVDKIVGPGNAFVAAAKRQVFGTVGIDMIAGPSEILVVADSGNDPAWIAADLLSQAEHDETAQAILITDDNDFADRVLRAVEGHLKLLPRHAIARSSWETFGAAIVVKSFEEAPALIDRLAPEHLELALVDADRFAARIRNAGAIFLGRHTPEAIGDYVAGPNHVLPTARSARFSSGLSVLDFVKRTTIVRCDADSLARIGPAAVTLARAEGFDAHALSISIRLNQART